MKIERNESLASFWKFYSQNSKAFSLIFFKTFWETRETTVISCHWHFTTLTANSPQQKSVFHDKTSIQPQIHQTLRRLVKIFRMRSALSLIIKNWHEYKTLYVPSRSEHKVVPLNENLHARTRLVNCVLIDEHFPNGLAGKAVKFQLEIFAVAFYSWHFCTSSRMNEKRGKCWSMFL